MRITSVTVGLPVRDLDAAMRWYTRVLELGPPELAPADGVVEFEVGPVWLQLGADPGVQPSDVALRFGVSDVQGVHRRLTDLRLEPGDIEHVPGAVDYFDLRDPDGNLLSFYRVVA